MGRHGVALRRAPGVVELRGGNDDEVQDQHRQDDVEEEAVEERSLGGGPLPRSAGAVHGSGAVRDIGLLVVELLSSSSSPHANAVVVWMGRG